MIYLLYVDESGDLNSFGTQKHFVLGAVAIHEGQVYNLTKNWMPFKPHFSLI